jgi:hypothetical protein
MLRSTRYCSTGLHRHTGPPIRRTRRPRAATLSPPLTPPRCQPQLWPAHGQIPIAERAAPLNPYPSPRFRALALFGRRPSRRADSLSCRRPKTLYARDLVKTFPCFSASVLSSVLSFARPRPQAFFRPDRRCPTPTRAEAVKAGRRAGVKPRSDVSRPRLDSLEHGGRLDEYGPTDSKQLAVSVIPRHVECVQQVQRRCPWLVRSIASPYIRQLRYGLPLCCMHRRSPE